MNGISKSPEGYIINFSENYISTLVMNARYLDQFVFFSGNATEQVIGIPKQERPELVELLESILQEEAAGAELKDDMIRTAMIRLFIRVNRLVAPSVKAPAANYNSVLLKKFPEADRSALQGEEAHEGLCGNAIRDAQSPQCIEQTCNGKTGRRTDPRPCDTGSQAASGERREPPSRKWRRNWSLKTIPISRNSSKSKQARHRKHSEKVYSINSFIMIPHTENMNLTATEKTPF